MLKGSHSDVCGPLLSQKYRSLTVSGYFIEDSDYFWNSAQLIHASGTGAVVTQGLHEETPGKNYESGYWF